MIDLLTDEQIDQVLNSQVVGRIGCHQNGKTYVVPVAYAFDGTDIYAHSRLGLKIKVMRTNPRVCFQVDVIDNLANWRSVLLHGDYEELTTTARQLKAYELLKSRLSPITTSDAAKPVQNPPPGEKKLR
ncbi:MAG: pyridoxamine 5'-phosphate oxidase family protein, partial [Bacteroidota bacterium]|nr:pyridoxamine 5'-phosphate oxidase family protein [Bacteroidota bacterium]